MSALVEPPALVRAPTLLLEDDGRVVQACVFGFKRDRWPRGSRLVRIEDDVKCYLETVWPVSPMPRFIVYGDNMDNWLLEGPILIGNTDSLTVSEQAGDQRGRYITEGCELRIRSSMKARSDAYNLLWDACNCLLADNFDLSTFGCATMAQGDFSLDFNKDFFT